MMGAPHVPPPPMTDGSKKAMSNKWFYQRAPQTSHGIPANTQESNESDDLRFIRISKGVKKISKVFGGL